MSEPSHPLAAEIEKRLDAATRTLSALRWLTSDEAERIGGRIDRLASQLAAVSPGGGAGAFDDTDRAD